MNIIESKEKLKKDGYTWFELNEFDIDFYNKLLPIKCNSENNIKEIMTYLRADINYKDGRRYKSIQNDYTTLEKAMEEKNKLVDMLSKPNDFYKSQIWLYAMVNKLFDISKMDMETYKRFIKKIVDFFYDFDKSQEYKHIFDVTYYDKGCFLANHSDGTGTGRVCALLIYLNEDYDENDGGILILNNKEKVVPKFGRVAIIDLQTFDIPHMVTEITGGIGRYALLTFVSKKENEFIDIGYNPMIK